MRCWDASAIVPLLVAEPTSSGLLALFREDPHVAVWWSTHVEVASAITRREQAGAFAAADKTALLRTLHALTHRLA